MGLRLFAILGAFVRAVCVGSIVGAGPILIFTVPFAIANLMSPMDVENAWSSSLYLALLPLIVAVPIVTVAGVLIGIPTFLALRALSREGLQAYVAVGGCFGLAVPLAALLLLKAEGGYWISLLGLFSGAATAFSWWRFRARALDGLQTGLDTVDARPL